MSTTHNSDTICFDKRVAVIGGILVLVLGMFALSNAMKGANLSTSSQAAGVTSCDPYGTRYMKVGNQCYSIRSKLFKTAKGSYCGNEPAKDQTKCNIACPAYGTNGFSYATDGVCYSLGTKLSDNGNYCKNEVARAADKASCDQRKMNTGTNNVTSCPAYGSNRFVLAGDGKCYSRGTKLYTTSEGSYCANEPANAQDAADPTKCANSWEQQAPGRSCAAFGTNFSFGQDGQCYSLKSKRIDIGNGNFSCANEVAPNNFADCKAAWEKARGIPMTIDTNVECPTYGSNGFFMFDDICYSRGTKEFTRANGTSYCGNEPAHQAEAQNLDICHY